MGRGVAVLEQQAAGVTGAGPAERSRGMSQGGRAGPCGPPQNSGFPSDGWELFQARKWQDLMRYTKKMPFIVVECKKTSCENFVMILFFVFQNGGKCQYKYRENC